MQKTDTPAHLATIKKAAKRLGKRIPDLSHAKMLDHVAYALHGVDNYHAATKLYPDTSPNNSNIKQYLHLKPDYYFNLDSMSAVHIEDNCIQITPKDPDQDIIEITTDREKAHTREPFVVKDSEFQEILKQVKDFLNNLTSKLSSSLDRNNGEIKQFLHLKYVNPFHHLKPDYYFNLESVLTVHIVQPNT